MRRSLLKLLAAFTALLVLCVLGCAGIYLWAVIPPSGSSARAPEAHTPAPQGFTVSGVVVDEAGLPAEGVPVAGGAPRSFRALGDALTRSAEDGRFSLRMERPGPVRVMGLVASPASVWVEGDAEGRVDGLIFTLAPRCALAVWVGVREAGGAPTLAPPSADDAQPIESAEIFITSVDAEEGRSWARAGRSDAEGWLRIDPAPCGAVALRFAAEGYATWLLDAITPEGSPEGTVRVLLPPAALIDGQVTDASGAPIEDARIFISGAEDLDVRTDAEGSYVAWARPEAVQGVSAWKTGYLREERDVRLEPDAAGVTLNFVLSEEHEVEVFCAGLPDDSCAGIDPILCTSPFLALGPSCSGGGTTVCRCPGLPAAIRGGGQAARVEPGQREVWLDFGGGGEVIGAITAEGAPTEPCRVDLIFAPERLFAEISGGLLVSRRADCDAEGRFELLGLTPGTYRLDARGGGQVSVVPEVVVRAGQTTDVGTLALGEGGVITGVVRSGLTGGPLVDVPVMVSLADDPILRMPVNGDSTDSEGRYRVEGLPPARYRVAVVYAPFGAEDVEIFDEETQTHDLWLGHDELPEEQGFSFVRGGAGELLISALDPEGSAAEAGLRDGDVVVGAELFGLDLARAHPELFEEVLARYSGPGLTVQVERGEQLLSVDLD